MRVNTEITVIAGTPINAYTGMTAAQMIAASIKLTSPGDAIWINRYFVQMRTGTTGVGYVMDGIYGVNSTGNGPRVPSATVPGDLTAELSASPGPGQPGAGYSDTANLNEGIDLTKLWLDGSVSGDKIKLSFDRRN